MPSHTHATTTHAPKPAQAPVLKVKTPPVLKVKAPVKGMRIALNHNETLVRVTPRT